MPMRPPIRRVLRASAAAAAIAALPSLHAAPRPAHQAPASAPTLSFDVVVADRDGRVPETLGPGDLTVTVDGRPRRIAAIRRVARGPGAQSEASARAARGASPGSVAAEPSRVFLILVDENGLVRGQERQAVAAGRAFLDRLGMADRLALLQLPLKGNQLLSLTTDQPAIREALAGVTGRILPSVRVRPESIPVPPNSSGAPSSSDPDQPAEPTATPTAPPPMPQMDAIQIGPRGSLEGLPGLLEALQSVPGRKTVALFSAGVMGASPLQVAGLATSAVAARTVIYAFGLTGLPDASQDEPDTGPLEALASSTGGRFIALGRNPERAVGRAVADFSTCFVVHIEGAPDDASGRPRALRVAAVNRSLTARAPAWLTAAPDVVDVAPERAEESPAAGAPAPAAPAGGEGPKAVREPAGSARDAELQLALGRLFDYVEAYERQYSGLVAEEEYRQSARGKNARLRSDYLLVKLEPSMEWVSFRDVFEVDGAAVRDRDDRLKRLFLEPGTLEQDKLTAIRTESARYNIGIVERNINVPLFTLRFLAADNRGRFRFKLGGRPSSRGVETWRIQYEEVAKPTLIADLRGKDVRAKGWFLVDQGTGAVVEAALTVDEDGSTGEIVVQFRHDPDLGMWVPDRMSETYRSMVLRSYGGVSRLETIQDGTAFYRKFRRFQVKTEETIAIPK